MAITLRHQIGAIGGVAAYAAGRGRARERQRKYTLDLARDAQARQDRLNIRRQQRLWQLDDADRRQMERLAAETRAFGRVRARDAARDERESERDAEYREWRDERDATAFDRERMLDIGKSLPEIPDWLTGVERRELEKDRSVINGILNSPDFDINDEETRNSLQSAQQKYLERINGLEEPSGSERSNRNVVWRDSSGIDHDTPVPGSRAFDLETGKFRDEETTDPVLEEADKLFGKPDPSTGLPFTMEGAIEQAKKNKKARDAYRNRGDETETPEAPSGGSRISTTTPGGSRVTVTPNDGMQRPAAEAGVSPAIDPDGMNRLQDAGYPSEAFDNAKRFMLEVKAEHPNADVKDDLPENMRGPYEYAEKILNIYKGTTGEPPETASKPERRNPLESSTGGRLSGGEPAETEEPGEDVPEGVSPFETDAARGVRDEKPRRTAGEDDIADSLEDILPGFGSETPAAKKGRKRGMTRDEWNQEKKLRRAKITMRAFRKDPRFSNARSLDDIPLKFRKQIQDAIEILERNRGRK